MSPALLQFGLGLAAVLFALGLAGVLARRNLLFMLLSIEVMFNATGLAFIVAGQRWQQPEGQIMFLFILAVSAAELAVGLALMLSVQRDFAAPDADALSRMRG